MADMLIASGPCLSFSVELFCESSDGNLGGSDETGNLVLRVKDKYQFRPPAGSQILQ